MEQRLFDVAAEPPAIALLLLATSDAIDQARNAICAFVKSLGLSERVARVSQLAVAQAVRNAVQHAYGESELGTVALDADCQDGALEIVVADRGHGLQGRIQRGAGMRLIAAVADEYTIGEACPHGVEVWMRFAVDR